MKNVTAKKLIIFFAALIMACAALIFALRNIESENKTASVYINGELFTRVDLDKVEESYEIKLSGNTILVQRGMISVIWADCPDKLCVKTGAIKNGFCPIVCLPNRLSVIIEDGEAPDAVAGKGH